MKTVRRSHRDRELTRVRRILERFHWPRFQMALIVALTGAVGFLASVLLLYLGVDSLWLRYPVSVAIAYLAFLLFLWCWLRSGGGELINGLDLVDSVSGNSLPGSSGHGIPEIDARAGGGEFGGGGASGSWDGPETGPQVAEASSAFSSPSVDVPEVGDALDLEGLAFVLLALVLLGGAAWAAFLVVWAAPALLAEVLLDAALATGLYRRLRGVRGEHWLKTAIRRTIWPFAAVAATFALAGALMQVCAPGAKSIGQVIQHLEATE
jgi:hypothetical protein